MNPESLTCHGTEEQPHEPTEIDWDFTPGEGGSGECPACGTILEL